jgi:hypothetical protein
MGAVLSILAALFLWWSLEVCTGWTDSELEGCFGIPLEVSQQ